MWHLISNLGIRERFVRRFWGTFVLGLGIVNNDICIVFGMENLLRLSLACISQIHT